MNSSSFAHLGTPEDRLQTLLEASLRLSQTIDYQQTLENIVSFVAERFATYSLLDILAEDGRIERVAVAHSDAERQPLLEELRLFNPPAELVTTHPVSRAIALGQATLEIVDDAWITRAALSAEHAAVMRELEIIALLVVPVANGARIMGALTCALDRRSLQKNFSSADIAFAQELGRRAGLAVEHARLYEHERRIAVTFQEAMLPRRLPSSLTMRLDAYYRPARSEATIGGDWFDAFTLHDGRIVLTVGDVVGKGLAAAVTMGRLRQAMQAAAILNARADALLEVADQILQMQDEDDLYATAVAAIYDPEQRTFELSSAGHPAVLLRRPNDSVECLNMKGHMLGLPVPFINREIARFTVEPGSMLVFFTDGLIEFDRDAKIGEARLIAELEAFNIYAHPRPARALVDAVLQRQRSGDDVAVLTATIM